MSSSNSNNSSSSDDSNSKNRSSSTSPSNLKRQTKPSSDDSSSSSSSNGSSSDYEQSSSDSSSDSSSNNSSGDDDKDTESVEVQVSLYTLKPEFPSLFCWVTNILTEGEVFDDDTFEAIKESYRGSTYGSFQVLNGSVEEVFYVNEANSERTECALNLEDDVLDIIISKGKKHMAFDLVFCFLWD